MNGTMTDRGSVTCTSLAAGSTCAPGAGYYSCISIKAANAPTLSGTANASHVLQGYTFYNNNASAKRTGTFVPAASYVGVQTASVNDDWTYVTFSFTPVAYAVGWDQTTWNHTSSNTSTGHGTHYGLKHY
jgi:hypothetical protein